MKERFEDARAKEIADLSKREAGCQETEYGQLISYRYAGQLVSGLLLRGER